MLVKVGAEITGWLFAAVFKQLLGSIDVALPQVGLCLSQAFERTAYFEEVLLEVKPVQDLLPLRLGGDLVKQLPNA